MPDQFGFDHLPLRGQVMHLCIECGWPEHGTMVSEADRERHHRAHAQEAAKQIEKQRKANLALARKAKTEYRQEG
jgi:hypothetical protein